MEIRKNAENIENTETIPLIIENTETRRGNTDNTGPCFLVLGILNPSMQGSEPAASLAAALIAALAAALTAVLVAFMDALNAAMVPLAAVLAAALAAALQH